MKKHNQKSDGRVTIAILFPILLIFVIYTGIIWLIVSFIIAWVCAVLGLIIDYRSKPAAEIKNMSGTEFEKYVADVLRYKGFFNIRMTPVTGDYGVDITAEKDGVKYAFQCKRYSSPVGVKAVQEVYSGQHLYGADRAVVVCSSSYTPNAKTLAGDLGVTLWDLEMLDAIL